MRRLLVLLFAALVAMIAGFGRAQTNAPASKPGAPLPMDTKIENLDIHSEHGYFNDPTRQMVYYSHVIVTYPGMKLTCERLTIDVPTVGQPTNIVAETNVIVHYTDQKGTNLLTSDKLIYSYHLVNGVTNELVTATGHAKLDNAQLWETGEPFIWDNVAKTLNVTDPKTHFKQTPGGNTNGSPLNFMK
jgi:hypothetical protein